MRRVRKLSPWLWGVAVATLLFAVLWAFASFRYVGSDDAPILRAFMGYEGGEPTNFHLYVHTAFAWLLWALATVFPGVAWFSILQLFLLWFSQVVIVKCLVQLSRRHGHPAWAGAFAGAVFLLAFVLYITCRITYTTTAALCGAAAVAQLASVDFTSERRRTVIEPLVGSAGLLLCGYCLRQVSVLPPLCFWLLTLAVKLLSAFGRGKRPWRLARPVFSGVLIVMGLFATFIGVRALDIRLNHAEDFLAWQEARISLFDYTDFDTTTTDETLAEVGWSRDEFTLVGYWYFMDDNITADAFRTLRTQQDADDEGITFGDRLTAARATVADCLRTYPAVRYGLWATLLMAAAVLAMLMLRGERNPWLYLGVLATVAGGLILLFYLGYTGRLPMRAAMSILLPMAACLWCALPGFTSMAVRSAPQGMPVPPDTPPEATDASPVPRKNPGARAVVIAMAALALGGCLWITALAAGVNAPLIRPMTDEQENYGTVNLNDLDAYALDDPDTLFIYDLSLVSDPRLFPDTSAGIPDNVMFWGGYPARSPNWYRMLAKFGITELDANIFLRDNVVLASTDPEPWHCMMNYVQEATDESVDWSFYDIYGYLFFFQLVTF